MSLLKRIDMPPTWLLGAVLLASMQAKFLPAGLSLAHPLTQLVAGLLVGAGLLLMALAVFEMLRQRTMVDPHGQPAVIVQSGIFSRSRNPIYLADGLLLTDLILWFDAILSLVFVPLFVWVIERRFITTEEAHLRRTFRVDFARYEQKVRRWI